MPQSDIETLKAVFCKNIIPTLKEYIIQTNTIEAYISRPMLRIDTNKEIYSYGVPALIINIEVINHWRNSLEAKIN